MNSLVFLHYHPSGQVWETAASEQMAFYKALSGNSHSFVCVPSIAFWVGGGGRPGQL